MPLPTLVILGAGAPAHGTVPAALMGTDKNQRVLDWLLAAFTDRTSEHLFVGGYQLDNIVQAYPHLNYVINPNWPYHAAVGSLLAGKLSAKRDYFCTYSDVLYRQTTVTHIDTCNADIVLAVDSCWQHRYANRSQVDMQQAEIFWVKNQQLVIPSPQGKNATMPSTHSAEFVGLVKFSRHAIHGILDLEKNKGAEITHWTLPLLINHLASEGFSTAFIDVKGEWAELNAPQDLAQFILGTKAETLERLRPLVTTCAIGRQIKLCANRWRAEPDQWLQKIQQTFGARSLAIRSSASNEDSFESSGAGSFTSVLHVNSQDNRMVRQAIEKVVASYATQQISESQHVLIQAMVNHVAISGVAFTRTLSYGAPYYVINYDDLSARTDTVTGGNSNQLKTLILHKTNPRVPTSAHPALRKLITSLQELEALVGYDLLDIEFIIDTTQTIHILQIRPITVNHNHWRGTDHTINQSLAAARLHYLKKARPSPFLFGEQSVYGIMPDWNPAEIIGIKPRSLSFSLYQELITDHIWAKQRAEFGYRTIQPQPLMIAFAGHPYIDLRASFNSFIPRQLNDTLAKKLVKHYLCRIIDHPHYHDKIEFEVAFTCQSFSFAQQADRLHKDGFSTSEVRLLSKALSKITEDAFRRISSYFKPLHLLEQRYIKIVGTDLPPLEKAFLLLQDAKIYGTLPFAHLARCAFVAVTLLNSAVSRQAITMEDKNKFLNSIHTVAKQYRTDVQKLKQGSVDLSKFLEKYGHLRPGTYDVTALSYREIPDKYLKPLLQAEPKIIHESSIEDSAYHWTQETKNNISHLLQEANLPDDFNKFLDFTRSAIEGREYSKFIFTRNLSKALDYIICFAEQQGLTRDEVSHLPLSALKQVHTGFGSGNTAQWLKQHSQQAKQAYEINLGIELPPIIASINDFYCFLHTDNEPNFVSHTSVRAPVIDLQKEPSTSLLQGHIVMIPQADPGFDWLFGHAIAGLVTAYGGANSHMAIRSAEFGLPAAIGIGKLLYDKLKTAKVLNLDCSLRRIEAIA